MLPVSVVTCCQTPTSGESSQSKRGHRDPLFLQDNFFGNDGAGNGLAMRRYSASVTSGYTRRVTTAAIYWRDNVYRVVPTAPSSVPRALVGCLGTMACPWRAYRQVLPRTTTSGCRSLVGDAVNSRYESTCALPDGRLGEACGFYGGSCCG